MGFQGGGCVQPPLIFVAMQPTVDILWGRRDWVRVTLALTVAILVTTVALPGPALLVGLVAVFYLLNRQVSTQEALLGTFLFATALASSRLGPHQFMKPMRLPLLALLAVAGLARFRTWTLAERRAHVRWVLLLLFIVILPTIVNSAWRYADVQIVLLPGGWFIYGTMSFHLTKEERTERFRMFAVLLPAIFLSALAFGLLFPGAASIVSRFRGWFGNPNEVSHFWLAAIPILLAIALRLRRRDLLLVLGAASLYLFLKTGSRTPLGAAAVMFVGTWFMSKQTPRLMRLLGAVLALLLVLVLPLLSMELLGGILPETVLRTESLEEGGGRFVAWRFGWEHVQERFWLGGGAGFEEVLYKRHNEMLLALNHQGLSHNSYLAFALNFGVLGTAGLVVTLWRKLGLLKPTMFFIGALPFLASTFFEGCLTSPLNALSPIWFFSATLVSQELNE